MFLSSKPRFLARITLVIALNFLCLAEAQVLSGARLNIGSTPQGNGDKSGAIGSDNNVLGSRCFAVGSYNTIYGHWSHDGNVAIGAWNTVAYSFFSAAIGYGNLLKGENSLTVGAYNTLAMSSDGLTWPRASLVGGQQNYVNYPVSAGLVSGTNNHVESGDSNVTLGRGLINHWDQATVVGRYNDSTAPAPPLFVVGNGVDANSRSNALEVRADGKILMPRQGDILMGEFGNGGGD